MSSDTHRHTHLSATLSGNHWTKTTALTVSDDFVPGPNTVSLIGDKSGKLLPSLIVVPAGGYVVNSPIGFGLISMLMEATGTGIRLGVRRIN
jgi:hypothetical protein